MIWLGTDWIGKSGYILEQSRLDREFTYMPRQVKYIYLALFTLYIFLSSFTENGDINVLWYLNIFILQLGDTVVYNLWRYKQLGRWD